MIVRRALLLGTSVFVVLVLGLLAVPTAAVATMSGADSARDRIHHEAGDPRHRGGHGGGTVLVHFTPSPVDDCSVVVPFERRVRPVTPASALRALLAGPTADESAAGYTSWFSSETAGALNSVRIRHGVARVDLADLRQIIPNASSSCGSAILLSQLDSTVLQFPGIDRVVYSFDGDVAAFYEFLQLGVPEGF